LSFRQYEEQIESYLIFQQQSIPVVVLQQSSRLVVAE
jgi:hypothetical protein